MEEIIQKIINYIKDCQDKGYEDKTIVENLNNEFILQEILKER